ncbi:WD repeat-containing protein on Y chromosome-like [Erpetoichthys calabaricus]|uniref:WD repeat-containing protein on Y chromosome-like n=1 Tax=Erpetoichthys calabaricus TaxID=27687 RepID=UPI00109F686B|nr:WD repeat-containing protein on Y chromosome-like [Erpetoichthys calabaricus]
MEILGDFTYKEDLQKIENIFNEGGGSLNMNQFRQAVKSIREDMGNDEIDMLFMKLDVNCDGTVDWHKYLDYMVQEYRERECLEKYIQSHYFPKPMEVVYTNYCEPIVRLLFRRIPQNYLSDVIESRIKLGEYLSITRDGILKKWNDEFKLLYTIDIYQKEDFHTNQKLVIDMTWLFELHMIAVCSTYRDVEFFDLLSHQCKKVFSLGGLDNCVLAMHYWSDGQKGVFCCGDSKGSVLVFISLDVYLYGIFSLKCPSKSAGTGKILVRDLLRNKSMNHLCYKISAVHDNMCKQIRYISDLHAVVSCSSLDDTGMAISKLPYSCRNKVETTVFYSKRGILCFDYSSKCKCLITGGFDCIVRKWNPHISSNSMSQMEGHQCPVDHIAVDTEGFKAISISRDNDLRVWNLLTAVCIQNFRISLVNVPLFAIHYDDDTKVLAFTGMDIGILFSMAKIKEGEKTSHDYPLCTALYNSSFKQVVSGCRGGMVTVWDLMTGKKAVKFMITLGKRQEITAMAFDGPKRRLITGCKDGTLRLWNFMNGSCLAELPNIEAAMVTGILYINRRIYVSGWCNRVFWYLDAKKNEAMDCKQWKCYNSDNIWAMNTYDDQLLVTASCSGDIIAWHISAGQAFCRLNAEQSLETLAPVRVFDTVEQLPLTANLKKKQLSLHKPLMKASSFKSQEKHSRKDDENYYSKPVSSISDKKSNKIITDTNPSWSQQMTKDHLNTTEEKLDQPKLPVHKVHCLRSRKQSSDTAIVLTSSGYGHIYAWSVSPDGGLLGKFQAVSSKETFISTMVTDKNDQILLTGDTNGYLRIWDIENFCHGSKDTDEDSSARTPITAVKLHDLIPKHCRLRGKMTRTKPEELFRDGFNVVTGPPDLLSSWRPHLNGIVHIEYIDKLQIIITASLDCNVRLWRLSGTYIGTFGQDLWNVGLSDHIAKMPSDLQRSASYQTLKVLNEGLNPYWRYELLTDFQEMLHGTDSLASHFQEIARIASEEDKSST